MNDKIMYGRKLRICFSESEMKMKKCRAAEEFLHVTGSIVCLRSPVEWENKVHGVSRSCGMLGSGRCLRGVLDGFSGRDLEDWGGKY
ncbi:hypothetical protein TNCV_3613321 [Trichonephila clavipes]|uniref:Uncharacterized protein n=1 Tax=Trichonephila clavipes TaxID=2585209 RepID=A0A8X6SMH2_TRICX|nr:hypothetical protein TNCV_3613321 [Trichonephila clavipes]